MSKEDILNEAISFEEKGNKAYSEIAEKSEDKFIKNLFLSLAQDELEHEKFLKLYKDSLKKGQGFYLSNEGIKTDKSHLFGMDITEFKDHAKMSKEDLGPFDTGIELEKQSIEYYKKGKDETDNEDEKKVFETLIKAETTHLESLKKSKEFLENPADGFMEMEHWVLEG